MKLIVTVIVGLLLVIVLGFAIKMVQDKSISFFSFGDKYCEETGYTATEFSDILVTKLGEEKGVEEATKFYLLSADCFGPDDVKMSMDNKIKLFCKNSELTTSKVKRFKAKHCTSS